MSRESAPALDSTTVGRCRLTVSNPSWKQARCQRSKLKYHEPLSKFAFKFNLRRYNTWLALTWRVAYKRAVQQVYRSADGRVTEAEAALVAGVTGPQTVKAAAQRQRRRGCSR